MHTPADAGPMEATDEQLGPGSALWRLTVRCKHGEAAVRHRRRPGPASSWHRTQALQLALDRHAAATGGCWCARVATTALAPVDVRFGKVPHGSGGPVDGATDQDGAAFRAERS
jgi:hypothetical protein